MKTITGFKGCLITVVFIASTIGWIVSGRVRSGVED